jgi:hypothetical protein
VLEDGFDRKTGRENQQAGAPPPASNFTIPFAKQFERVAVKTTLPRPHRQLKNSAIQDPFSS